MKSSRTRQRALRRTAVRAVHHTDKPFGNETDSTRIERAIDLVADMATEAVESRFHQSTEIEASLVAGDNNVSHGLGRRPRGLVLTPKSTVTGLDWSFDWDQPGNPIPDRVAVVNVSADVTARIVFF